MGIQTRRSCKSRVDIWLRCSLPSLCDIHKNVMVTVVVHKEEVIQEEGSSGRWQEEALVQEDG
eukprot:15411-Eustigmatos_ZCMA.PRE.1